MDNLLEILVPLIIGAVYFLGNMFSGKADEDDQPKRRTGAPEDAEAVERQRRIQEEIRRKIMERRREAESGAPSAPPVASAPTGEILRERRRAVGGRLEHREARKETREQVHEQRTPRQAPQLPPHLAPTYEAEPVEDGRFSWDKSDDVYDNHLQAQLQQIEATKRQAERLKKQVAGVQQKHPAVKSGGTGRSSRKFGGSVRSQLRDPAAARAAFVYGEVIGQPVSMRKQSSVPGLG